mmetsp:Transcript_18900/g.21090  ORF Transcript_18900/g.21090 Transcript_18900/m.21090 type:complete len:191 (-) Transcript_18900:47-619(-)|eukprot:CAMPEP_0194147216 /NCGR_PEP_ID=MMETSP0152-20130528/22593_1 /TAXON_ID=1049557 /ORGANISM="Thalassiothrix antarctica, Strain L6-D1" /LENGTH=190 /DNA_ID=CAMNT_0038847931 /DNA_START=89 /DNA_END=661 /DNA_ORIENTATION=-
MSSKKSIDFNLNITEGHEGYDILHECPKPNGMTSVKTFSLQQEKNTGSGGLKMTQQQKTTLAAKKRSRALALATKPGQQILMNAFMMFMSGKNLNIFSISITSMAILSPIKSIFSVEKTFAPLESKESGGSAGDDSLQLPKLAFIAINLLWLAIGIYKMSIMRLLPTTSADWTGEIVWKEMLETTSIPPQ